MHQHSDSNHNTTSLNNNNNNNNLQSSSSSSTSQDHQSFLSFLQSASRPPSSLRIDISTTSNNRDWKTELRRDAIELRLEFKTKEATHSNTIPYEIYASRTYTLFVKILNYQPDPNEEEKLFVHVEVLEWRSLAMVNRSDDPTKSIVEGTTWARILTDRGSIEKSVPMKIRLTETNYSKALKLRQQLETQQYQQLGAGIGSAGAALQPQASMLGPSSSSTASLGDLGLVSALASDEDHAASMKKQIEELNAGGLEFFRMRVIVYAMRTDRSSSSNHRRFFQSFGDTAAKRTSEQQQSPSLFALAKNQSDFRSVLSLLDVNHTLGGASSVNLVPIISKISAPFKCYSKKQHFKKKDQSG